MQVNVHDHDGVPIVECASSVSRVTDAVDLIAACIERGSRRLLIDSERLPAAFFDLRSQFAGEFVQRFVNYGIRLAAVIPPDPVHSDRFREFLHEARAGREFRVFAARAEARSWLASGEYPRSPGFTDGS